MKNMKKALFVALVAAMGVSGCATTSPAVSEQYTEPLLIGGSVDQKILDAANEVKGQLALLVKLERGDLVGPAQTVRHNQNLDARNPADKPGMPYSGQAGFNSAEWATRVNIKWKNNGVDLLLSKIAQAVGYSFSVRAQSGVAMKNIDMSFDAEPLSEVVKKISTSVDSFADVSVSHKNKTITLIYRQQ